MGPALLLKVAVGPRFSLTMYGLAQIAMDIEPLVRIVRGDAVLHGPTHTYLGAVLIGLSVAVVARPLCNVLLRAWGAVLRPFGLAWLTDGASVGWRVGVSSALIGTISHILLDSFMHRDIRPLAPFSDWNGLVDLVPISSLNSFCIAAGGLGVLGWIVRRWRQASTKRQA